MTDQNEKANKPDQTNSTENSEQQSDVADVAQQIDADLGESVERIDNWIDSGIELLPNIILGIVLFFVSYGVGVFVKRLVKRQLLRRDRDNLGEMLGSLLKWIVILLGFLLAATIVVPTLNPGDMIAGLGVSSVAIGFAFKDILQNWLAGLLLLLRKPFEVNDQIEASGFVGTVERIETRATLIKTFDGQRVVIPNSDIYTNAVLVKTAFDKRRSQYEVGIGYGDDIEEACEIIRKAIEQIEEIEKDPAPSVLAWELAASWVTIRIQWWTNIHRSDMAEVRASVIIAIKRALDGAHIDMPYNTQVTLLHDQTETTDGDRGAQREGWPAPKEGTTQPRWRMQQNASNLNHDKSD
ncbi:Small-conductance mechanosensitive channel [Nitrosomonas aestuarii]|uniref:Small-conductance mechanosensitive channel n=1 Tax=Nitrosomonas aestuarii TaxID=52441 RepID=A0A1I4GFC1_9PROT|nr:mechanosensitive ion channel family protein [Nitrosomonas aestuarii]SFL27816.1 Small-conductance mechanosensitive channel [Nitrosomonas aestuarii]